MPGCVKDDIAIIINAFCPENIGTIVSVLEAAPPRDGLKNWYVTSKKGSPVFYLFNQEHGNSIGNPSEIIDDWLVPIRPGMLDEDEIVEMKLEFESL